MCVIYLLSERTRAQKDHGRLVIETEGKKKMSVPLQEIEHVVIERRAQLTMPVLYALLEHKTQISYLDGQGNLIGTLGGEACSLRRLLRQREYFSQCELQLALVREVVRIKIQRQKEILQGYAHSKKAMALVIAGTELAGYAAKAERLEDLEELRGLEGMASRRYFSSFAVILEQNIWHWQRRSHPAADPVNALLNYGYAFLEREVRRAIAGAGLDCRIGFFHSNNGRKDSLVYDLMERFRAKVTDRLVLKLLNYGAFSPDDFLAGQGGCRMVDGARNVWLEHYEKYMGKAVQEYDGQSPREKIRAEVEDFAARVFRKRKEGSDGVA